MTVGGLSSTQDLKLEGRTVGVHITQTTRAQYLSACVCLYPYRRTSYIRYVYLYVYVSD